MRYDELLWLEVADIERNMRFRVEASKICLVDGEYRKVLKHLKIFSLDQVIS